MNRCCSLMLLLFVLVALIARPLSAQKMPRENVVDVPAKAEGLCVSNVFQSNMVLQRDKPIHLWGWASPDTKVAVSFAGKSASGVANELGKWKVTLPACPANASPENVVIEGGEKKLVLENVLVGDVWLLGGQSNMEFELAKVENGSLEIVSANYPQIRILTIPQGIGPDRKEGFERLHEWSDWFGRHFRKGDWEPCTPDIAKELSAIGYVFARRIHQGSQIPIGVIDASRGGTTVETWTPRGVLRELDSEPMQAKLARFEESAKNWDAAADLKQRVEQHRNWIKRMKSEEKPIPENRAAEPTDLRPGPIGDHNFPGHCYAGMIAPLEGLSIKGAISIKGTTTHLTERPVCSSIVTYSQK